MSKKYVRLSTVFLVTLLVGVLLTAPAFAINQSCCYFLWYAELSR